MRSFGLTCACVLLLGSSAWAQKVVLLSIEGDDGTKLRDQIERAVTNAGVVDLVPMTAYAEGAKKKGIKKAEAMTADGLSKIARVVPIDAAVSGEIVDASTFRCVIWDRAGGQLWTKTLPIKKGLLTEDFAQKLARAIAAAATQGAKQVADKPDATPTESTGDEGIDLSGPSTTGRRVVVAKPPPDENTDTNTDNTSVGATKPDNADPDADLERESMRKKKSKARPPYFRAYVGPAATWRSQCVRPGVATCKDYDLLPTKPTGVIIDFGSVAPYWGVSADAELFPLAGLESKVLQGFGLLGHFQLGLSTTTILQEGSQGSSPPDEVRSTDIGWSIQAAWRFHFQMGFAARDDQRAFGWAGLRGGLMGRSFEIDPNATVPLPSSVRVRPAGFPVIGLDVSLPIAKAFRVELGGTYFFSPLPAVEQILGYGNLNDRTGGAISTGFSFNGGVAGDFFSAGSFSLGYRVHLNFQSYTDQYYGQGQKWTICDDLQCGGVSEESYTTVTAALTASY